MRLVILAFAVNSVLAFMLGWFAQGYTIYHGMMGNMATVVGGLE